MECQCGWWCGSSTALQTVLSKHCTSSFSSWHMPASQNSIPVFYQRKRVINICSILAIFWGLTDQCMLSNCVYPACRDFLPNQRCQKNARGSERDWLQNFMLGNFRGSGIARQLEVEHLLVTASHETATLSCNLASTFILSCCLFTITNSLIAYDECCRQAGKFWPSGIISHDLLSPYSEWAIIIWSSSHNSCYYSLLSCFDVL